MIVNNIFILICITCVSALERKRLHITEPILQSLEDNILEADVFRNVSELITSKGYPVEEYDVTTLDGYILGVQRIPHGRTRKICCSDAAREVIFLQHGLLGESSNFVINFPHNSLAFVLADAGYDVWMGNSRGNTYSRRHIKYDPDSKEFWEFTWDEMAKFDLPAMIDYILDSTGHKKLTYVGFSQGTTIMFALLSESPKYNNKIKLGIALAPVATVGHVTSPIRYLSAFTDRLETLEMILGSQELAPSKSLMSYIVNYACDFSVRMFCTNLMFMISGFDLAQLNQTRFPVYMAHSAGGTSSLNIIHFTQLVNSMTFQKMDYGKLGNLKKYNTKTSPDYDVRKITAPIALFWGLNDALANPTDVLLLERRLGNLARSYRVLKKEWSHLDFVQGIDADKYVYKEVLKLLSYSQVHY